MDYAVLFSGLDEETLAHEILHSFGLPHTFTNNVLPLVPCTFKAQETHNMMDYSHWKYELDLVTERNSKDRFYTWYWQWRIINRNIN